jgi:hypothetical protein
MPPALCGALSWPFHNCWGVVPGQGSTVGSGYRFSGIQRPGSWSARRRRESAGPLCIAADQPASIPLREAPKLHHGRGIPVAFPWVAPRTLEQILTHIPLRIWARASRCPVSRIFPPILERAGRSIPTRTLRLPPPAPAARRDAQPGRLPRALR